MVNSTLSYFVLSAYLPLGGVRFMLVLCVALIYALILVLNWFLVVLIVMSRSLHEPMYLLLCSLFVNELYGSGGVFPFLLLQVPLDVHVVSAPFCFLQIFCLYTYAQVEFCTLALMAYDRYLAICYPLQYHTCMTLRRAGVLVFLVWMYSFLKFLVTLSLNLRLTYCGNTISSVYCHNYLVAKLACSGPAVNNIYGLFGVVLTVVVPLVPIVFSYGRILTICYASTGHTRQKALSTCTPQLVSLLNFSFGCCFEILQSRFDVSALPGLVRVLLSLYFLVMQPLLNPLMYGVQMRRIREATRRLLCPAHTQVHGPAHTQVHGPAHTQVHRPAHTQVHGPAHRSTASPTHRSMAPPTGPRPRPHTGPWPRPQVHGPTHTQVHGPAHRSSPQSDWSLSEEQV